MPITYFPPAVIDTGGSSDWGNIGGNIDEQIDLFALLNAKSDITHNHAGVYEPRSPRLMKQLAVSTHNCENTDTEVSLLEITIPRGSMQDGQMIVINYALSTYQNSGADNDLTIIKRTENASFMTNNLTFPSNLSMGNNAFKEVLLRRGNKLLSFAGIEGTFMIDFLFYNEGLDNSNFGGESSIQDFSADIVYKLTAKWSAAHANSFIRVLAASAYFTGGV